MNTNPRKTAKKVTSATAPVQEAKATAERVVTQRPIPRADPVEEQAKAAQKEAYEKMKPAPRAVKPEPKASPVFTAAPGLKTLADNYGKATIDASQAELEALDRQRATDERVHHGETMASIAKYAFITIGLGLLAMLASALLS